MYIRKSPLKASERRQIILNSSLVDDYNIKCYLSSTQERERKRGKTLNALLFQIISAHMSRFVIFLHVPEGTQCQPALLAFLG